MSETIDTPMRSVVLTGNFTLVRDDGTRAEFKAGRQMMREDDLAHWFVAAHLEGALPGEPALGSPDYAKRMRVLREARRAALAEADALLAEAEEAEQARKSMDPAHAQQQAPQEAPTSPEAAPLSSMTEAEMEAATMPDVVQVDPAQEPAPVVARPTPTPPPKKK